MNDVLVELRAWLVEEHRYAQMAHFSLVEGAFHSALVRLDSLIAKHAEQEEAVLNELRHDRDNYVNPFASKESTDDD